MEGETGYIHLKCWNSILGCFVPDISQENDCQKKIEFWVINIPLAVGGQSLQRNDSTEWGWNVKDKT